MDKSLGGFLLYLNTVQEPPLACTSLAGYGWLAQTTDAKMPPKPFVLQAFPRRAGAD